MMLKDVDLLAGIQEVRGHMVDNGEEVDLPAGDETPGWLLSGYEEPLEQGVQSKIYAISGFPGEKNFR